MHMCARLGALAGGRQGQSEDIVQVLESRSGQARFITRPKSASRTMRAKRKETFESQQNEGAQMSNERESDRAMVMNLERLICQWRWLR
jgi:hypothetical protein